MQRSSRISEIGLSLVELLVVIGMVGIALSAAAAFASTTVKLMRQDQLRLEVRQALRATGDSIIRDVRLAGACLPQNGSFIALAGSDAGAGDRLTIRTGLVQDDLSCIATSTSVPHPGGATTLTVDTVDGFGMARMGYLRHLDGDGEFFTIADVDPVAKTITRYDGATRDYPVGSGVLAVDERTYAMDYSSPTPQMTLDVDRTGAIPFATGMTQFSVQYTLNRNCPPCDVVDVPANDSDWWLVTQVAMTVTAETVNPLLADDHYSETRTMVSKPRNLLQ